MGPYPVMQYLHADFTTGSVLDTANSLRAARDGGMNYSSNSSEEEAHERFIQKIDSINRFQGFLYDNVPGILVPGGMQRKTHYNDVVPKGSQLCSILDYDVDDGNSRLVSYVYYGLLDAPVVVGRRKA